MPLSMLMTPVGGLYQYLGTVSRADRLAGSSITKFLDFIRGRSELDWPAPTLFFIVTWASYIMAAWPSLGGKSPGHPTQRRNPPSFSLFSLRNFRAAISRFCSTAPIKKSPPARRAYHPFGSSTPSPDVYLNLVTDQRELVARRNPTGRRHERGQTAPVRAGLRPRERVLLREAPDGGQG